MKYTCDIDHFGEFLTLDKLIGRIIENKLNIMYSVPIVMSYVTCIKKIRFFIFFVVFLGICVIRAVSISDIYTIQYADLNQSGFSRTIIANGVDLNVKGE